MRPPDLRLELRPHTPSSWVESTWKPWLNPADLAGTALPKGRSHPRAQLQTELWLGMHGIVTRSTAVLRDLSEGGAFVETSQRFGVGEILSIRFRLPNPPVFVDGTVTVKHERQEAGIGVKFVDLSDDNRRRIREFVTRHGVSSN